MQFCRLCVAKIEEQKSINKWGRDILDYLSNSSNKKQGKSGWEEL